ncbi:MAG: metallophosphoesterase [Phycisphaerae bacterium]|nr:metallophosphoesterase [Phycisphaerae bacterium]
MNGKAAIAVIGDTHGHLQLALCVAARWQHELGISFEAVLLCGDVGTFTGDSQLDSTTRRHGKANPCELEFLTQWSAVPQAPWLSRIFLAEDEDGLGLTCPVIMVHGNHEGFEHLAKISPAVFPDQPVSTRALPSVDTDAHIRFLPSGWRVRLVSGCVIAGIGGIELGQRYANYHDMAYVDHEAMLTLLDKQVDVLMTHQGPSGIQGQKGSENLQVLLDHEVARVWCHGHSIEHPEVVSAGPRGRTKVVPLGGIAFSSKGPNPGEPGENGWCILTADGTDIRVKKQAPPFLREFRRHRWTPTPDGLLIAPPLSAAARQGEGAARSRRAPASVDA